MDSSVPLQVVNLLLQPSESGSSQVTITLRWDEPESDASITRYEGNYREASSDHEPWIGDFTTTQFTYVYRNLTNEVDYVFRVRAVSAIGAGRYAIRATSGI